MYESLFVFDEKFYEQGDGLAMAFPWFYIS